MTTVSDVAVTNTTSQEVVQENHKRAETKLTLHLIYQVQPTFAISHAIRKQELLIQLERNAWCGVSTSLWNTRAQVCMVSNRWVEDHLPGTHLRRLEELREIEDGLNLKAANGTSNP